VTRELGHRIREARRAAGFTNAESLAVALGVGMSTVQRWETGKNSPSVKSLIAIAQLTEKPVSFFLTENEAVA